MYSFTILYYFLTHYLSLSHTQHYKKKNTKIINARITVTLHICTVIVTIVHLYIILHLPMWIFFGSKCAYLNTFSILHYFTFTDASALIGLRATTSVHAFYTSIFTLKIYFFYFTPSLLQNTHISSSILTSLLLK